MKSRIELVINGETVYIPIEITDEQILQLTKAVEVENPPTGWELPEVGENCSYLTIFGEVASFEKTQNQICQAVRVGCFLEEDHEYQADGKGICNIGQKKDRLVQFTKFLNRT